MAERCPDVEYHDGDAPVCVGQWCCGCAEHPIGKPWGWNHEAWDLHFAGDCHPLYTVPPGASPIAPPRSDGDPGKR